MWGDLIGLGNGWLGYQDGVQKLELGSNFLKKGV